MFRSFQPFLNPIGFGAADFLELGLAALLVFGAVLWPRIEPAARRLAARTRASMLLCGLLPILLRLALLPGHPTPAPVLYDEFSHLLAADTLTHLRLANPVHPMHRFFETFFVLQEPSYASIYPIGPALALAAGKVLFGHPWAGVVLSTGLLCALVPWTLRAWTSPGWALAAGLLAVIQLGPLSPWMNSYWGGAVSACAGCLVFGALPRLRAQGRPRDALLLGTGLGLQLLARPYESIFLAVAALSGRPRRLAIAAIPLLAAAGLTLLHSHQVTGSWSTLPGLLSRYQYGVPATFTFQPLPVPHRELTREQRLGFEQQAAYHGTAPDSPSRFVGRLRGRAHELRFFLAAPLWIALPAFLLSLRERRSAWIAAVLLLFTLGSNVYPFFFPHYIAAVTPLLLLAAVIGLDRLPRQAAVLILTITAGLFLLWYGLHLAENREAPPPILRYEGASALHRPDGDRRAAVAGRLAREPGKLLVFVRYWPNHIFQDEWVSNAADIGSARIVWARDLGPSENPALRRCFTGRSVWLFEPDARPPRLTPFPEEPKPEPPPPPAVETPQARPSKPPSQPSLRFEDVR